MVGVFLLWGDIVIKQFIHDMIHMTEGEKLIHYWWLWLTVLLGSGLVMYVYYRWIDK